ncbi:MAG: TRIC cation channel family protein [Desulfovibrio sp.]|jgi:uncharacterized membrane protein YeiH|nr:TRIC cation channel family protein [Desulfovibrio sp.]
MGGGPLFILDLAACALLAAAAACKARDYGVHVTGSMVLACLAGLSMPLLRDGLLGVVAFSLDRGAYPASAVSGGLVGLVAAWAFRRGQSVFNRIDGLALALAAAVSAVKGQEAGLGPAGCLVLALASALAGGLIRDAALGDSARAVEEPLYVTAAVFGALLALALTIYGLGRPWQCALAGAALTVALRFLKERRSGNP